MRGVNLVAIYLGGFIFWGILFVTSAWELFMLKMVFVQNSFSHCLQIHSHLYSPCIIVFLIKDWNFIINLSVYGSPSILLRLVVKARSDTNCWTHLPHLEGGWMSVGLFFPKLPSCTKTHQLAFKIYSLPIIVIYNQLDVSIYQQYIINKSSPQWTQRTQDVCTIFFLLQTTILGVFITDYKSTISICKT